ncbi:hypothetical protein Tco_0072553 [Tanacetum coccineum]
MRMEQYLTHTDYALWEVIVNGDAPAIASASTEGPIPPKLAIPDGHLLKFMESDERTYGKLSRPGLESLEARIVVHQKNEAIYEEYIAFLKYDVKMPSRPDLSFAGLDDSVYKTNVSETITSVPRNESTTSKSSKDNLEQPKDVRPSAPIIEEWETDCVIRPSFEQNKPSYAKINFVKSDENTRKSVIEQHTNRQAEKP